MAHITVAELLHRLDSPIDTDWGGWELVEEMDEYLNTPLSQHGFTAQPIFEWMCTDTTVGYHVIYLHGEPVCLSTKEARKASTNFSWFSEDAYWRVRRLIHELAHAQAPKPMIDTVKLEALVPAEYSVEYSSQLIYDWVLYEGERCEVVNRCSDYNKPLEKKIVIRGTDGVERTVDVRDVRIPVPLKP